MSATTPKWLLCGLLCATLTACAARSGSVPYLIEPVQAQSPPLPPLCQNAQAPPEGWTQWLVFISPGCAPCRRFKHKLETQRERLRDQNIQVTLVATLVSGDCIAASRQVRGNTFPYAAATLEDEERWAIRATPTLWVVDPLGRVTLYVEGDAPLDGLWP